MFILSNLTTLRVISIFFIAALYVTTAAAQNTSTTNSDANQPTIVSVVFNYTPNKIAAGVAGGLYLVASASLFSRLVSARSWWGLCLPIAACFMGIGFFVRIPLATNQNSLSLFMIQQLFIILPPAAYLAFNYILYGRFIVQCVDQHHSLIKPERVARIFVASDITTFLIQGGGGGLQASTNVTTDRLGARILLVGLVLQTVSFALFILLVIRAHRSIIQEGIRPNDQKWGPILKLLHFSSFFFMVRCIYRVIELAQGNGGYLLTHEVYFYCLDSLPLLIGISIYIFFWPARYFGPMAADTYSMQLRP